MNRQIPQWIGLNSRRINDFDWEIRRTRPQSTPIKPLERNEQTSTQTCPVLGWKSALDLYRVVSLRLVADAQPAFIERLLRSRADGEEHHRALFSPKISGRGACAFRWRTGCASLRSSIWEETASYADTSGRQDSWLSQSSSIPGESRGQTKKVCRRSSVRIVT